MSKETYEFTREELEELFENGGLRDYLDERRKKRKPHPNHMGLGTAPTEEQCARLDLDPNDFRSPYWPNTMLDETRLIEEAIKNMTDEARKGVCKDILDSVLSMPEDQIRVLVRTYYQVRKQRIAAGNRIRAVSNDQPEKKLRWKPESPHSAFNFVFQQNLAMEKILDWAIEKAAKNIKLWEWAQHLCGVGEKSIAVFYSFLDIRLEPSTVIDRNTGELKVKPPFGNTVSSWWKYAGMAPGQSPAKGDNNAYVRELKSALYNMGEAIMKNTNRHGTDESGFYVRIFKERLAYETMKNENGDYADQAAAALRKKHYKETTTAYQMYRSGKLPKAHLRSRARKWMLRIFLSHLHFVWWRMYLHQDPPVPFAIGMLGHADLLKVPCWDYENDCPRKPNY